MEGLGVLDLGRVAQAGEFHESGAGDALGRPPAHLRGFRVSVVNLYF